MEIGQGTQKICICICICVCNDSNDRKGEREGRKESKNPPTAKNHKTNLVGGHRLGCLLSRVSRLWAKLRSPGSKNIHCLRTNLERTMFAKTTFLTCNSLKTSFPGDLVWKILSECQK